MLTGFVKCTPKELRERRKTEKIKKNQIVWINRRTYFQPPQDTLEKYLDFMRRYEGRPRQREMSIDGSNYFYRYRHKILNTPKGISKAKSIANRSKTDTVYIIVEEDRPDAEYLIGLCREMIDKGVW